jgi:lipoprotein-anchoring transpeptidase ErfK/SrfK
MPHSIFFNKGIAIHGTEEIKRLGRPASHGCIRLHPENARALYQLVKIYGMGNTRISVKRIQPAVELPAKSKFPVLFNGSRF